VKTWKSEFLEELTQAQVARERGKEGRARVCARRAAGIAVRRYYSVRQLPSRDKSAHDILLRLARDSTVGEEARLAAQRLTRRVSETFSLRADIDLIREAARLADLLEAAVGSAGSDSGD